MPGSPASNDFDGWVARLAHTTRRQEARGHLLSSGSRSLPALRRGLRNKNPVVRQACAGILDNLVDEETLPDLVAALDDQDDGVVIRALHALSCEPCKQNGCNPAEDLYIPRAVEFLRAHPNPDVRAGAVEALGKVMRRRPDVIPALVAAAEGDRSAGIRNMARIVTRRVPVAS